VKEYAASTPTYEIHNLTLPVFDDSEVRVFRPQNAAGSAAVFVVRSSRPGAKCKKAIPMRLEDEVDAGSGFVASFHAAEGTVASTNADAWETMCETMDDELKFVADDDFDWRKTRFKFGNGFAESPKVPTHFIGEPVFIRVKVHNPLDAEVIAENVTLYGGYIVAPTGAAGSKSRSRPRRGSDV